jgi:hypothetical protein
MGEGRPGLVARDPAFLGGGWGLLALGEVLTIFSVGLEPEAGKQGAPFLCRLWQAEVWGTSLPGSHTSLETRWGSLGGVDVAVGQCLSHATALTTSRC